MKLADEQPHLKLISRMGGAYLLPLDMLSDARDFLETRDVHALLVGTDIFGAEVLIERSDVVSLIVMTETAITTLEAEHVERRHRAMLNGELD